MELVHVQVRDVSALGHDDIAGIDDCDALVLATPHGAARSWVEGLRQRARADLKILDLSDAYRQTPGVHYGFPELFGLPPASARLVANPGCYPTATLAVLRPLVSAGVVRAEHLAVVGASGASGAGKTPNERLHFCNLSENTYPYNVGHHRHAPEIERHLGAPVSFVTQLMPIIRGMLITAFVRPTQGVNGVKAALHAAYADHPWVSVLDTADDALGVRHVVGSHQIFLAVGPTESSGMVPVFAAIDNLMRGAASSALHNLNGWLGLDPGMGLPPPLPAPTSTPRCFSRQQIPPYPAVRDRG